MTIAALIPKETIVVEQTPKKPNLLVIWGDDIG